MLPLDPPDEPTVLMISATCPHVSHDGRLTFDTWRIAQPRLWSGSPCGVFGSPIPLVMVTCSVDLLPDECN